MTRTNPWLLIAVLVLVAPLSAAQEDPLARVRGRVEAARAERDAALAALQDRYIEIEADHEFLRSGDWQILSGPYREAIERAEGTGGDTTVTLSAAFAEAGLLSETVSRRLAAAAARLLAGAGEEKPDSTAILAGATAAVFPDESFPHCWDTAFQDLPEIARWRTVNEDLSLAEEALQAAETRASLPEGTAGGPPGMVLVPKGRFVFGPWTGWQFDLESNKPGKEKVDGFYIDVQEVANHQYLEFLEKREGDLPDGFLPVDITAGDDGAYDLPDDRRDLPVRGVTFAAALAYAKWAGKRLPTEEEWEKAARGEDGLPFPWGEEFDPEAPNWEGHGLDGPTSVGANPKDVSPYGVLDMGGNVAEFTSTLAGRRPAKGRLKPEDAIVIRGGNYHEGKESCAATYRWTCPALNGREPWIGFRCVISEKEWK